MHLSNPGISLSQQVTADARLGKSTILMGEPTTLILKLNIPESAAVQLELPNFSEYKLEVLEDFPADTVFLKDESYSVEKKFTLTSFDTGLYYILPISVFVRKSSENDTVYTERLSLKVEGVAVDLSADIKDIKPPIDAPFILAELWDYFFIFLLFIAFAVAGYFVWKTYIKKNSLPESDSRINASEPAHIIAIRNLEQLKEENLIKKNQYREFHSRLSDHVRHYLQNRFELPAMEQTSDEIIYRFLNYKLTGEENVESLKQILLLADQVKFAKVKPSAVESEQSLQSAWNFVNNTKVTVEPVKKEATK